MTGLFLIGLYLVLIIPIAFVARKQMEKKSPHEFYLAGGKLGFVVLFCTLFATQYSGNTFLAFPGKTYRLGYAYMMSIPFMMAIVFGYLFFAPRLKAIANQKKFLTPADWIHERYGSKPLTFLCAGVMVFALMNFLLAQLMAMGHAFSGFTEGRIPYAAGVLFLALIVVFYESIGGMRSVAWTDVLQGFFMLVAVLGFVIFLFFVEGGLSDIPEIILEKKPQKILPPDGDGCRLWLSSIFLFAMGGSMYPQGIQRIYGARSAKALKRSLILMVFVPLLTVFFAYLVGITAIAQFASLGDVESDRVMTKLLSQWSQQGPVLAVLTSFLMLGAIAAMMSTADSVLLSLASILTHDFYERALPQKLPEEKMLRLGKWVSWLLMGGMVLVALKPELTLWKLLEIKFELLMQVAPAFILGFYLPRLGAAQALCGMVTGCLILFGGMFLGVSKWHGIHFGTLACLVNFLICFLPFPPSKEISKGPVS